MFTIILISKHSYLLFEIYMDNKINVNCATLQRLSMWWCTHYRLKLSELVIIFKFVERLL